MEFVLIHVPLERIFEVGALTSNEYLLHKRLSEFLLLKNKSLHDDFEYLILDLASTGCHDLSDNIFDSLNSKRSFDAHIVIDVLSILGGVYILFLNIRYRFYLRCLFFLIVIVLYRRVKDLVVLIHVFKQDVNQGEDTLF